MPWNVKVDPELGLIEDIYSGCVTNLDIKAATAKALAIATNVSFRRFLANFSDAETVDLSTIDLYALPKRWLNLQADRRNRSAVLVPDVPAIRQQAKFYESACINRGWQVQVFSKRQDALDWSMAEHSSNKTVEATLDSAPEPQH